MRVAALLVLLIACNGDGKDTDTSSPTTDGSTTPSTPEPVCSDATVTPLTSAAYLAV